MVRIRLDLPERLYHKAQAVVQYSKAQNDGPHASSLSNLVSRILSQWIDKHVTFKLNAQGLEVKEIGVV